MQICTHCHRDETQTKFYEGYAKRIYRCIACNNLQHRERRTGLRAARIPKPSAKTYEEIAEYNKNWKKTSPRAKLHYRKYNLRRYGLTLEDFDRMMGEQNGLCANQACRMINDGRNLEVDHKHIDGFFDLPFEQKKQHVRGLLCTNCNLGLGHFMDSLAHLEGAINYLGRY